MSFDGLKVVSFESRMALPMQRLIEKQGGEAFVAPSMKEIPLENNDKAYSFYHQLCEEKIDLLILMTGVGLRTLLATLEKRFPKEEILNTLSTKTKIIVRGPKPRQVCKINDLPITVEVPEPNTWREILTILQEKMWLANHRVAVLEYGQSNDEFLNALRASGADLEVIPVYQWGFPEDLAPLHQAMDRIIAHQMDVALFTSANQVVNLFRLSQKRDDELELRRGLRNMVICSIGPVCSERLREYQIFPDFEVTPNKMQDLVEQAAKHSVNLVAQKKSRVQHLNGDEESPILRACNLKPNDRIPIWLMRQAGRYMEEYQIVRRKAGGFKELCKNPELAAEATLDAVERLGVDAAIIFSDILLITEAMGLKLEYHEGIGPLIETPVRNLKQIENLKEIMVQESLGFVLEACKLTRKNLSPNIPLIGFCGAPFTVASYMIEGRGSKNFIPTKTLMHSDPIAFHLLLEKITSASIDYLQAQIQSGCQLVQVFDSWAGILSPDEYRTFVLPHSKRLILALPKNVPVIHFGLGSSNLIDLMAEAGGQILGVDSKMDIMEAWDRVGKTRGIQGNLDPTLLFSEPKIFLPKVEKILNAVGHRPGFIFNLGHGILPETPVDHVMALVDFVHGWKDS